MAIFVSNPTSAAPPPLIADGQDPTALESVEGFTEELAAAMLPAGGAPNVAPKSSVGGAEDPDKKASDLQILPAEVLKNAVGDANFALAAQGNALASDKAAAAAVAATAAKASNESEPPLDDASPLDVANDLQAAELAAANLAAQMSAAAVPLVQAAPVAPTGQANAALDAVAQSVGASSTAPSTVPLLDASQINASNAAGQEAIQAAQATSVTEVTTRLMPASAASQTIETFSSVGALPVGIQPSKENTPLAAASTANATAVVVAAANAVSAPATAPVAASVAASVELPESAPVALTLNAAPTVQQSSAAQVAAAQSTNTQANSVSSDLLTTAQPMATGTASATSTTTTTAATAAVITSSNAKASEPVLEESAFKFDAKLSKSETINQAESDSPKSAPSLAQASTAISSTMGRNRSEALSESVGAMASPSDSLPLRASPLNSQSDVRAAMGAPEEASPVATQSLEDLSSSFVSSLVGGPQRPVNTVMDWISTRSQERPAPVLPHEVRLDAGAVQLEIQKMVKQGGGHVVMELTPPDQSKFTIELKLDERGGALLVVDGVSDSTRTRLEQSAPQLREQFQQMGLELQLDMRQQNQSASSSASDFSNSQNREDRSGLAFGSSADAPKALSPRELGANRARETGANQVYLYA
jgi:hypothetical protein